MFLVPQVKNRQSPHIHVKEPFCYHCLWWLIVSYKVKYFDLHSLYSLYSCHTLSPLLRALN